MRNAWLLMRGRTAATFAAVLLTWGAAAQPDALDSAEAATAAVEENRPDMPLQVRAFQSGLRVTGISVAPRVTLAEQTDPEGIRTGVVLPEYMRPERFLGVAPQRFPLDMRLLWTVEAPSAEPIPLRDYAVELVHHQGYARRHQTQNGSAEDFFPQDAKAACWTAHRFAAAAHIPPGAYDVLVTKMAAPVQTVPLGQLLLWPSAIPRPEATKKLTEAFPGAINVFSGDAALTRWFYMAFPIPPLPFAARKLLVVSSADYLEDAANETPVATITVEYASGQREQHALLLGRHTASTWHRFHARGSVKHRQAPIAWSWRVVQETAEFDACAYKAVFDLAESNPPPASVSIAYDDDREGILRLWSVAFLP
ncbi:MAG TPA: hypothetical protein PLO62_06195 [Candidatus Hydrogenedentes bacterium]|nr:hypothetical protein [Candidatus Hydrogenedentota bacterium]HOS01798.1 hypothetical protein [Candidatus Hydrogenedentota bacterium]